MIILRELTNALGINIDDKDGIIICCSGFLPIGNPFGIRTPGKRSGNLYLARKILKSIDMRY